METKNLRQKLGSKSYPIFAPNNRQSTNRIVRWHHRDRVSSVSPTMTQKWRFDLVFSALILESYSIHSIKHDLETVGCDCFAVPSGSISTANRHSDWHCCAPPDYVAHCSSSPFLSYSAAVYRHHPVRCHVLPSIRWNWECGSIWVHGDDHWLSSHWPHSSIVESMWSDTRFVALRWFRKSAKCKTHWTSSTWQCICVLVKRCNFRQSHPRDTASDSIRHGNQSPIRQFVGCKSLSLCRLSKRAQIPHYTKWTAFWVRSGPESASNSCSLWMTQRNRADSESNVRIANGSDSANLEVTNWSNRLRQRRNYNGNDTEYESKWLATNLGAISFDR